MVFWNSLQKFTKSQVCRYFIKALCHSSQTPLLKSSWRHPRADASLQTLYFTLLNPAFNSESTEGSSFSGALKIKQNKSYNKHSLNPNGQRSAKSTRHDVCDIFRSSDYMHVTDLPKKGQ